MTQELTNTKKMFTLNGVTYTQTKTGYCFKTTGLKDKKGQDITRRIPEKVFTEAYEEYTNAQWDAEQEIKARKEAEDKKDRETEEAFNGTKTEEVKPEVKKEAKKAGKPRKSKDIAHESNGVTLTAKQVDFMKALPTTSWWEEGVDSTIWCDCIAEEIGWNPMSVGAMISTLREKGLVEVTKDTSRKGNPKSMAFTENGKEIARCLGLK